MVAGGGMKLVPFLQTANGLSRLPCSIYKYGCLVDESHRDGASVTVQLVKDIRQRAIALVLLSDKLFPHPFLKLLTSPERWTSLKTPAKAWNVVLPLLLNFRWQLELHRAEVKWTACCEWKHDWLPPHSDNADNDEWDSIHITECGSWMVILRNPKNHTRFLVHRPRHSPWEPVGKLPRLPRSQYEWNGLLEEVEEPDNMVAYSISRGVYLRVRGMVTKNQAKLHPFIEGIAKKQLVDPEWYQKKMGRGPTGSQKKKIAAASNKSSVAHPSMPVASSSTQNLVSRKPEPLTQRMSVQQRRALPSDQDGKDYEYDYEEDIRLFMGGTAKPVSNYNI
jgi:hypothetical protein